MVHDDVRAVVQRYLQLVDLAFPRRVHGLYLVGSVALDDFRPGQSDVDFVALTENPLSTQDLDGLETVHRELAAEIPRLWFDGIYITSADLKGNPMELANVPFTLEGRFERTGGFEAHPSTWLTMRNHPLSIRGPAAPAVWHDPAITRQWNVDNLNSYWQGVLSRGRSAAGRDAFMASNRMLEQAIAWCVPGVARLHYTIALGDVTSKSGACRYALDRFPEQWHPIVDEAMAIRNGSLPDVRSRRRRYDDMLDFMQFVIADGNALAESGPSPRLPHSRKS